MVWQDLKHVIWKTWGTDLYSSVPGFFQSLNFATGGLQQAFSLQPCLVSIVQLSKKLLPLFQKLRLLFFQRANIQTQVFRLYLQIEDGLRFFGLHWQTTAIEAPEQLESWNEYYISMQ